MQAIGFIVYIVVGLFQLAAIMAGLESWWGLGDAANLLI